MNFAWFKKCKPISKLEQVMKIKVDKPIVASKYRRQVNYDKLKKERSISKESNK